MAQEAVGGRDGLSRVGGLLGFGGSEVGIGAQPGLEQVAAVGGLTALLEHHEHHGKDHKDEGEVDEEFGFVCDWFHLKALVGSLVVQMKQ